MNDPLVFLINPKAGGGAAHAAWPNIEALLREAAIPYEAEVTASIEEAIQRAREWALRPVRALVAVGGDGTVHGLVNGLLQATQAGGGYLPLGVVAVGKNNDFARALGLPVDKPIAATRRLLVSQPRRVDVGWAQGSDLPEGERYFANGLGVGLGNHLARRGSLLAMVQGYRPLMVTLTLHGVARTQPLTLLSVGNSARMGGQLMLTPEAVLDDGHLDICVTRALPRRSLPRFLMQAMSGTHAEHVAVTMERTTHLVISSATALPLQVDGEVLLGAVGRVEVEALPGRLAVLV